MALFPHRQEMIDRNVAIPANILVPSFDDKTGKLRQMGFTNLVTKQLLAGFDLCKGCDDRNCDTCEHNDRRNKP
jgi:hypothetical protein